METILESYALLDAQIKALTIEKEEMRDRIILEMKEAGEDKVDSSIGKFSIAKLKTWTYPEKIVQMGENFKAAKAKAESTGDATYEEKESLRFVANKL